MRSGEGPAPAVFFDRDGTLMEEVSYCRDPREVRVFAGAAAAVAGLRRAGYKIFVATNQAGIGRGLMTADDYRAVHAEFLRQLGADLLAGVYYCPHAPAAGCACRKPQPGMVHAAARDHALDLSRSWFVGDKESDIGCGRAAGLRTILVQTGYGREHGGGGEDFVAKDVVAAARLIVRNTDA